MKIREIKKTAKADLKGGYGYAILTLILLGLVLIGSVLFGPLGLLFASGAVTCCYVAYFADIAHHERKGVDSTYRGFCHFMRAFVAEILRVLILYAPAILIGILLAVLYQPLHVDYTLATFYRLVAALLSIGYLFYYLCMNAKFYFVYNVMVQEETLSGPKCLSRSFSLTKGSMWRIIGFDLSFLGWRILVLITFGCLGMYVTPYFYTAKARFFEDILARKEKKAETAQVEEKAAE